MIKIRLKEVIWQYDISAAEIHRRTGLNKANLSNIMRGKHTNVGLDTIDTLCRCIGCKLHELLEYTQD